MEYVGPETIDIAVTKQIVILERRGDQLPEPLKDEVFIYFGGLPKEIKKEVQQFKMITGITKEQSATERKVIELGGSNDNDYRQTKQIVIIGISQKCDGLLRLVPDRGRNLVQCLLNQTGNVVIEGQTLGSDTRTVEIIGGGPSEVENIKQREVIIKGSSGSDLSKHEQEVVLQGKSVDDEVHLSGKSPGSHEIKESVLYGKGPSGASIVGKLLEISGGTRVNVVDAKKYVEIGSGALCNHQLEVTLIDSTLNCLCNNDTVELQYLGKGPTDLEIIHHSFIIDGNTEMAEFQNQDFVMVYVGGIPDRMKTQAETIVVTEVYSQEENGNKRIKVMEKGGKSGVLNRNQRQVVLIGLSRKCNGSLQKVVSRKEIQIHCIRAVDRPGILAGRGPIEVDETIQTDREVALHGNGTKPLKPVARENRTLFLQGKGSNEDVLAKMNRTLVIQGQSSKQNEITHKENKTIVLKGKGSENEEVITQQKETVVFKGQGPLESPAVRNDTETRVLQGQGPEEIIQATKNKTIVIQGQGSNQNEIANKENKTIVLKGKGSDNEKVVPQERETVVFEGQGPLESPIVRNETETVVLQGQGPEKVIQATKNKTIVIQGQGSNQNEIAHKENKTVILKGKGSNNEKVVPQQRETVVLKGQGPLESPTVRNETETLVLQGQGPEEVIKATKNKAVVIQGQGGSQNEMTHKESKTTVLKGKGRDHDIAVPEQKETIVLQGKGSSESQTVKNETETLVLKGQGPEEVIDVETKNKTIVLGGKGTDLPQQKYTQYEQIHLQAKGSEGNVEYLSENLTVVLAGHSPAKTAEKHEAVILQGQSAINGDVTKENKTVVLRGMSPVTKNNTLILQGGSKADSERFMLQGQGPAVTATFKENKTLILQGKGTDFAENIEVENKTIVLQGKDADATEQELRKDTNKTIAVKGKGPEEIKKVQNEISLIGIQEHIAIDTTTPKMVTAKPDVIVEAVTLVGTIQQIASEHEHDVKRIVLIGNHEYVTLDQSHQTVEIESKTQCDNNFKITSENNRLSVKCVDADHGLNIVYMGVEDTDIEIKTYSRLEKVAEKQNLHDKIYIHLTGLKHNINEDHSKVSILPVRETVTAVEEQVVFVSNVKEDFDENHISIVDIGIRQTNCKNNSLGQYTDSEGTVVYCRRRADILPDDYDNETSSAKEAMREFITLIGSMGSNVENDSVNLGNRIDGEFMESKGRSAKELRFKVVSENVSTEETGIVGPSLLLRNHTGTFPSSLLKVLKGVGNENDSNSYFDKEDRLPERGDISIQEYDESLTIQDEAKQSNVTLKTPGPVTGNKTKRLNVEVNKTVDIKVSNDCTGKVEVMESDGNVIVKCTVGGDTFEINLVGLYQTSSDNLQDQPIKTEVTKNKGSLITTNELRLKAKGNVIPDHLLIQHVKYASHKTYIGEKDSKSNITLNHLNVISSEGNQIYKHEIPAGGFMEIVTQPNQRRGDVPINGYTNSNTFKNNEYQADSTAFQTYSHKATLDIVGINDRKRLRRWDKLKSPSGNYGVKKYGLDMEFINGKYDDFSIGGFQHAFSTDFKKGVKQYYNRVKYHIPTLSGSRIVKKIKTLKGSRPNWHSEFSYLRDGSYPHNGQLTEVQHRTGLLRPDSKPFEKISFQRSHQKLNSVKQRDSHRSLRGNEFKSVSGVKQNFNSHHGSDFIFPGTKDTLSIGTNHGTDLHDLSFMPGSRKNHFLSKSGNNLRKDEDLGQSTDILLNRPNLDAVTRESVSLHRTGHIKGKNFFSLNTLYGRVFFSYVLVRYRSDFLVTANICVKICSQQLTVKSNDGCDHLKYSQTSIARTPMARLPWLIRTCS